MPSGACRTWAQHFGSRQLGTRGWQDLCHTYLWNSCIASRGVQRADETGARTKQKHRGSWSLEQLHCATTPGHLGRTARAVEPTFGSEVKSAHSAATSIQLLVERIRAARALQSAGERAAICGLRSRAAQASDIGCSGE